MRKKKRAPILAISLALALQLCLSPLAQLQPAAAHSQTYDQTVFSYTTHPDMPLKLYAAGRLGVISSSYARSYQIVAYRYLTGNPLTAAEQADFLALWHRRLHLPLAVEPSAALHAWLKDRSTQLGTREKEPPYDDVIRWSQGTNEAIYLNCQDDAFKTARSILASRVAKYGRGSSYVKEWLKGQDDVFCHCSGPQFDYKKNKPGVEPPFPQALPADAPLELRQDRDYQIAAAHFYAQDLQTALELFSKVAGDVSSPWASTAKYMMVRTLIRQSALSAKDGYAPEPLVKAIALIKELRADKKFASFDTSLAKLLDYAELRLDPLGSLDRLARELSRPSRCTDMQTRIDDLTVLMDNYFGNFDDPEEAKTFKVDPKALTIIRGNELTDWIWTYSSNRKEDIDHAVDRLKATGSALWAVAVAEHSSEKGPHDEEVLAALARVSRTDPAYLTASYYRSIILNQNHRFSESLAVVNEALTSPAINPSSANDLYELKAKLITSFNDFMACAFRAPAVVIKAWDYSELPEKLDDVEATDRYPVNMVRLEPLCAIAFNKQMPLSYLVQACNSKLLPVDYRRDFSQAAFVRAVMLGDYATAGKVVPLLESSCPDLAAGLAAFQKARTPIEHDFAAAFIILQNPGMRPNVTGGTRRAVAFNKIDEWRDNWWMPDSFDRAEYSSVAPGDKELLPLAFLSQADKAEISRERAKIVKESDSMKYLGKIVLAYAQNHGGDPRLPEALSRIVKATKFRVEDDAEISSISEKAFSLLHSKYAGSIWAKKTPVHY